MKVYARRVYDTVASAGARRLPSQTVTRWVAEYLKNRRGEETGDALLPVSGTVQVPAGESRQFWVRFDARTTELAAGTYSFEARRGRPAPAREGPGPLGPRRRRNP